MLPHPSTMQAVREFWRQDLLEEAARERRAASAIQGRNHQEGIMFGEDRHDWIVQRGIDEALACQDLLARAPTRPSLIARALARLVVVARSLTPGRSARDRHATTAAPRVAGPQETG